MDAVSRASSPPNRRGPPERRPATRVHLVEMGGRGGVHQHTAAVGRALADGGVDVVLHTAHDAEELGDGLRRCGCLRWSRRLPGGLRQPVTAARFVVRTCPHLLRVTDRDGIVHVQGLFGPRLTELLVWAMRVARRRVVLTPHNTFARSGTRRHDRVVRRLVSRADAVVVFTESDVRRVAAMGGTGVRTELSHFHPPPAPEQVRRWRERFGDDAVALLAGYVRADKRPELFLRACALAGVTAAIVGPEGDGEPLVASAAPPELDVVRDARYLPADEFVAAVAAADVVVATHAVGSASGPLAIARSLGVRTVAVPVGGIGEGALRVAGEPTPEAVAGAIRRALDTGRPLPATAEVAGDHLRAYATAGAAAARR